MNQAIFYLLQVIAASGLLYGYYHLSLRNKRFHRYNRFYLLFAICISIAVPFLQIPVYFTASEAESSFMLRTLTVISPSAIETTGIPATLTDKTPVRRIDVSDILYILYILVAATVMLKILVSLRRIKTIIGTHPVERTEQINFVNTDEPGTPFSFFRWLFWNRKIDLNTEKGEQIFRHELFHIRQKHSYDIIFMEILTVIFWINPFFHLIKKELKAIHEFLADEFAVNENQKWQYAELLLMQALNTQTPLVNPFFHNQIKRRIAMITLSQKAGHQYLRKVLVLPVIALVAVLFAFTYKKGSSEVYKAARPVTVVIDAGHGGNDPGAKTNDGSITEASLALDLSKTIQRLAPGYNIEVIMTRTGNEFPGGASNKNDALRKRMLIASDASPDAFISVHFSSSPAKEQQSKSGFEAFISAEAGNDFNTLLASSVLSELEKIYSVNRKIKQRNDEGIFVLDKNNYPAILLECGYINNPKDLEYVKNSNNQEDIARAILSGIVVFTNTKENISNKPDPGNYHTADTTKPRKDQNTWLAADTIVWINKIPKPQKKSPSPEQLKTWADSKTYGVWLDGKKVSNTALSNYKPSDFGLYFVSKLAKNAVNYGKHNYQVDLMTHPYYEKAYKADKNGQQVIGLIRRTPDTSGLGKNPLIIIDGKEMPGILNIKELDLGITNFQIEKIVVLKNENATKKYGEKGKNGVIEIVTKTGKGLPESNKVPLPGLNAGKEENLVFTKIEVEPAFPGGEKEWNKHLQRSLNSNEPLKQGCPPGTYKVSVQFIVDIYGNISDVKSLTHHGYGMEEQVIHIIKNGPKWIPGVQNGKKVKAYKTQPVSFIIEE